MAANAEDERIAGALLSAVLDQGKPCSVEYLQRIPGVRRGIPKEKIINMMDNFCQLAVVRKLPDQSYLSAEKADEYIAKSPIQERSSRPLYARNAPEMDSSFHSAPFTQSSKQSPWSKENTVRNEQVLPLAAAKAPLQELRTEPLSERNRSAALNCNSFENCFASAPLLKQPNLTPWSKENTVRNDAVQSTAMVHRSQEKRVQVVNQTYDCGTDEIERLTEKLRKLMIVLVPGQSPIHASKIAQLSGQGQSKAMVNRELHHLEKKGILRCDDRANWTCNRALSDEELRVCAADLAKVPPSKKNSSSQLAQPNLQQPNRPSGNDCSCSNRGEQCNHYHYHQTNNYYQQNIQVGDGNQLFFQNNGPDNPGKQDS